MEDLDFIAPSPYVPVDEQDAPFQAMPVAHKPLASSDIKDHFPFEVIRPAQADIMGAFIRGHNKKVKNIIIEAPTGIGKSALAYTMASWVTSNVRTKKPMQPGAYILTTQKSLQDQYMGDFGDKGMVELRGVANYPCKFRNTDCQEGRHIDAALKQIAGADPPCKESCPYVVARNTFMSNPISLTNFAYFLTVTSKIALFQPRPLLILDEAHNTEMQILSMQSMEITKHRARDIEAYPMPFVEAGSEADFNRAVLWCRDVLIPKLITHVKDLTAMVRSAGTGVNGGKAAARLESAIQFLGKIQEFCGGETLPKSLDWVIYTDRKVESLVIKSLDAAPYAKTLLDMGEQVVFMSATILDPIVFARSLGLAREDCGIKRLDSEFPIKNRLMHFQPCGSMAWKNKEATIPKWLKGIARVAEENSDTKGLIHCQSYDLANKIVDYFEGTEIGKRIITHPGNVRGAREEAIRQHIESKDPTILLSPSMTEGLDLKGDLSRWQIISKVPYPSLKDPFILAKKLRDEKWYSWMTALALTQATGRSVRSATDYASTYILDSDFESFLNRSGGLFPKWWTDAIVWGE
jgi:Rad3-related DNA helicase